MFDLKTVMNDYQCQEISNINLVRRPNNPADRMNKLGSFEPLIHLLRTGKEK